MCLWAAKTMHLWGSLGHIARAPAAPKAAGVPQDGPESPNVHLETPAFKNTSKIPRAYGKIMKNRVAERKKERYFRREVGPGVRRFGGGQSGRSG